MSDGVPEGSAEGIIKGIYLLKDGGTPNPLRERVPGWREVCN